MTDKEENNQISLSEEMKKEIDYLNTRTISALEAKNEAEAKLQRCNADLQRFINYCKRALKVPADYVIVDSEVGFIPNPQADTLKPFKR